MTLESCGCNGFHKMSQRAVSRYIRNHHQKPMKLAYPDPSLCCTELLTEPTVTRQCIIERESLTGLMIYLKIDVADVTGNRFQLHPKSIFTSIWKMHQGTACLCISDVYWSMVLEINKAIMYLKIRSSFTITKKKRQNTPNVPELGGMTHLQAT